jgi:hypothetical protein
MMGFLPYVGNDIVPCGARTGEAGEFDYDFPTSSQENLRHLTKIKYNEIKIKQLGQ